MLGQKNGCSHKINWRKEKPSVSITFKFRVNVSKCLFLMFSDKKVYNDQKSFAIEIISINRRKKMQMSYMTNIATDVMLTGKLDDR